MDFSIKQASQLSLYIILCSLFLYSFTQFLLHINASTLSDQYAFITPDIQYSKLELKADKIALKINEEYDLSTYVSAVDEIDGDISNQVEIYDNININEKGYYKARFVVKNSNGQCVDKTVDVRVDE